MLSTALITAIRAIRRLSRANRDLKRDSFFGYLLGALAYPILRATSKAAAARLSLRTYAASIIDNYPSYLVVPSVDEVRHSIDATYVTLRLQGSGGVTLPDHYLRTKQHTFDWAADTVEGDQQESDDDERTNDSTPKSDDQTGAKHADGGTDARLVVGDPGSGKSSLLKKTLRDECRHAKRAPGDARLAVLIECRALDFSRFSNTVFASVDNPLLDFVRQHVGSSPTPGALRMFDTYLETGGLLLLVDGLDEVPERYLPAVQDAISKLITRLQQSFARHSLVVTCRRQLLVSLPAAFKASFTEVLAVQPFSPADIYLFLRRWVFPAHADQEVARIFQYLREQPSLLDMCSNPLVLAMYVAHDQRSGSSRLPETRTDFYQLVVDELLVYRRQQQLELGAGQRILKRERQALLGALALDNLLRWDEPANAVEWSSAVFAAKSVFALADEDEATRRLRELSRDTGLFVEERRCESLSFIHLSICEYLAAVEMTERDESWGDTFQHIVEGRELSIARGRLAEVLAFSVAMLRRDRQRAALEQIFDRLDVFTYLRCAREAQAYQHPKFAQAVRSAAALLEEGNAASSDAWSEQMRLFGSCLLDVERLSCRPGSQVATPLQFSTVMARLVSDDVVRLMAVLDTYMSLDPGGAIALAEDNGVDLLSDRAGLMVGYLAKPDVLSYAVSQLVLGGVTASPWVLPLAEAGLGYQLVARLLNEQSAPPWLAADYLPHVRTGWHVHRPLRDTLYGALLTLALDLAPSPLEGRRIGVDRTAILAAAGLPGRKVASVRATERVANLRDRRQRHAEDDAVYIIESKVDPSVGYLYDARRREPYATLRGFDRLTSLSREEWSSSRRTNRALHSIVYPVSQRHQRRFRRRFSGVNGGHWIANLIMALRDAPDFHLYVIRLGDGTVTCYVRAGSKCIESSETVEGFYSGE